MKSSRAQGSALLVAALVTAALQLASCARSPSPDRDGQYESLARQLTSNIGTQGQYALTALIRAGAKAVPAVVPLLRSSDPYERQAAINVLKNVGAPAKPALPALR